LDNISSIKANLIHIRKKIDQSAERAGRKGSDIILVAVTKTHPAEAIKEAISGGITNIGENRIQESKGKLDKIKQLGLRDSFKAHLLGHLQTNKVKQAVELFDVIQSVDSIRLAEFIQKEASKRDKIQDCLVEVKVSEECTKFGIATDEVERFLQSIKDFKNIRVLGIMAMAPFFDDREKTRPYFKKVKETFDKYKEGFAGSVISTGMSNDFEAAIEEGSNMVRIGTAIFGQRIYK